MMINTFSDSMMKKSNLTSNSLDQNFYGHGKLLLTGEYFVLQGAKALALPTTVGQSLTVKYSQSFNPKLYWKSYDVHGDLWFQTVFEFWHFNCLDERPSQEALFLQTILRQARKQNSHFLRDEVDIFVETKLGFPIEWGLGSSSTLIYNIAQWAYISPFELLFKTQGGSGYDIACAQSSGPIFYEKKGQGQNWSPVTFDPSFKDQLFFIYLGRKQDSREAVKDFETKGAVPTQSIQAVTKITEEMLNCQDFNQFEKLVAEHETLVSEHLGLKKVKDRLFFDYWGEVKSLGAWGGDFALVTTNRSAKETQIYFAQKGYQVFIPYRELISTSPTHNFSQDLENHYVH